jgi:hypothetical protein
MKKIVNLAVVILIAAVIFKALGDIDSGKNRTLVNETVVGETYREPYDEKKYQNYSPESREYFKEIVLGREFEEDSKFVKRWNVDMKIYVLGNHTPELDFELEKIVFELNEIITSIEIEIVEDSLSSNMLVYFGSWSDFLQIKPGEDPSLLRSNWGLFRYSGNSGYMYVDIERANEIEQRHLLREELTQSLGLFNDSYKYPESIFYSPWSTVVQYAPIDRELIDMLYNN